MFKVSRSKSLVNVSNSLLKAFDVPTFHDSYRVLDQIIEANRGKKICLFLFDGLGKTVLKEHRASAPFIYRNRLKAITSVFPPTTVAATTALLSGRYPCETGWLGWRQFFKADGQIVNMFSSLVSGTEEKFVPTTEERLPFRYIDDLINERTGAKTAVRIMGHRLFDHGQTDPLIFFNAVEEALADTYKFIYAYYPEPDHSLHDLGNGAPHIDEVIKGIDDGLVSVVKAHPDVLFLSLADHGHIDFKWAPLNEHPDFADTLEMLYFCEARASMVNVKKGREDDFLRAFNKYYGSDFELYSKEEIKSRHIFGYSDDTVPGFDDLLGDYLMVAVGARSFYECYDFEEMVSTHAGGTKREGLITLSVYNND